MKEDAAGRMKSKRGGMEMTKKNAYYMKISTQKGEPSE